MARTYSFEVEPSLTIEQLKELFVGKSNIKKDIQSISFTFDEETLEDNNSTIASYGIEDKSIIYLVDLTVTNRSGFSSMGMKFVDIGNNRGLNRADWSKTGPSWRRTRRGLCLEGLCNNNLCEAYQHRVIIPVGYVTFDIIIDSNETTTICPLCKQYVEPITCGFNNCWWRYKAIKQDEQGKPPKKCSCDWQHADNAYHYFDEYTSGLVLWKQLIIEVVKNRPSE